MAISGNEVLEVLGISANGYPSGSTERLLLSQITNLNTKQTVLNWCINQNWIAATITRNSNEVVTSANVTYPDGQQGTFTATSFDSVSGAINSWVATYGSPTIYTITQPAVTRDANSAVIIQPKITII